jgi:Fe2+ or Zn2+ uptake regulation protein
MQYCIEISTLGDGAPALTGCEVLSGLRGERAPLGAYAILERACRPAGLTYPATVYRPLNDLIRLGFTRRIESLGLFIAGRSAPGAQRSGLICSGLPKGGRGPASLRSA